MIKFLHGLNEIVGIRTWAIIAGAPFLLGYSAWIVYIVAYGDWPREQAARRLDILGKSNWSSLGLLLVIVVALAAIARMRLQGPAGLSAELDNSQQTPPQQVAPHE